MIPRRQKRLVYCLKLLQRRGRWLISGVLLEVFSVAGSQRSSKYSLRPEDGCLDEATRTHTHVSTHLSAPKHTFPHLPALSITLWLRVQSYSSLQGSLTEKKKSVILTGFTFMKPVDLCSLHLPTGDCYTAENHCCNITCIVLGLRLWWAQAATVHCLWLWHCISSAVWVQRGMSPLLKTVLWIHNSFKMFFAVFCTITIFSSRLTWPRVDTQPVTMPKTLTQWSVTPWPPKQEAVEFKSSITFPYTCTHTTHTTQSSKWMLAMYESAHYGC